MKRQIGRKEVKERWEGREGTEAATDGSSGQWSVASGQWAVASAAVKFGVLGILEMRTMVT